MGEEKNDENLDKTIPPARTEETTHMCLRKGVYEVFGFSIFPVSLHLGTHERFETLHLMRIEDREGNFEYFLTDIRLHQRELIGDNMAFRVGRASSPALAKDLIVSGNHCTIGRNGTKFTFLDQSRNGTCLEFSGTAQHYM